MLFLCLEPCETHKNVLKFSKNWVLKFYLLLLGALQQLNTNEVGPYIPVLFALCDLVWPNPLKCTFQH